MIALDSLAMSPAEIRTRIIHALTQYDREQSRRKGYNPHALAHYCRAAQDIERSLIVAARPPRQIVLMALSGRVADLALRSIGEPPATADERKTYVW